MAPVLAGVHRTTRRVFSLLATVGLLTGMLAAAAGPVAAASFTVTTLDDGGSGSLRQAVAAANAAAGADTITFQPGLSGTITLTSGEIAVTEVLTIHGPGPSVVTVSGNNASRIFSASATLTVNGLTLTAGYAEDGGAIRADASLTVTNSTFSGNRAGHPGGAISAGSLTVTNGTFSNNWAQWGGAIFSGGAVSITKSTFSNNSGDDGGGAIQAGNVTVASSTFSGNSADFGGAGGAIDAGGVTVTNSTFSSNSGYYGGAISAGGYGGSVTYSTFSDNIAGDPTYGDAIVAYATVTVTNSILAGTGMQCTGPGTVSTGGGNRTTDSSCPGTLASPAQLALGPLAWNGGPTQTIALPAGSVAIDTGTGPGCPATDQRGVSRPQGAACDAGAYEYVPPSVLTPPVPTLARAQTGTVTLPVTLKWSGKVAVGGRIRYAFEERVNSGDFTPVTLSWDGALGITRYEQPGWEYQYRVQATDAAGNRTPWITASPFSVTAVPESDSTISYAGSWTQTKLAGAYGGSVRFATARGATASYFVSAGKSIGFVSTQGPDRGRADIYLDGARVAGVDLYAPTTMRHVVVYVANALTSTSHTLTVRALGTANEAATGTRVDVDGFELLR